MFRSLLFFLMIASFPVAAFAAGPCETGDPFPYTSPYEDMGDCAPDVQAWLNRVNGCGHFMGEDPYDDERRAELDEQMGKLGCATLGCAYSRLFAKYEGDIVYTNILADYAAQVFGSVDDLPTCAQPEAEEPAVEPEEPEAEKPETGQKPDTEPPEVEE